MSGQHLIPETCLRNSMEPNSVHSCSLNVKLESVTPASKGEGGGEGEEEGGGGGGMEEEEGGWRRRRRGDGGGGGGGGEGGDQREL